MLYTKENVNYLKKYAETSGVKLRLEWEKNEKEWLAEFEWCEKEAMYCIQNKSFEDIFGEILEFCTGFEIGANSASESAYQTIYDLQELASDLREEIANLEKRLAIAEAAAAGAAQQPKKRKM